MDSPTNRRYVSIVAAAIVVLLGVFAVRDLLSLGHDAPWRALYDFQDFYCAGAAVDARANPYLYEPLHRCEQRVGTDDEVRANPNLAVPAPQPPYDFLAFQLPSRLDFTTARALYAGLLLAAIALVAVAFVRISIPPDVAALAMLPVISIELNSGQIVPFALLALAWCGVALAHRRAAFAGILAALTLVEPHIGVFVAASVFAFAKESRVALAATALALAVAGVAAVGPAACWTYLAQTLPLHAAAETAFPMQYSLTYAAWFAGAAPAAALRLGELATVAAFAAALWLAPRTARALLRPELLAFVPAALAVTGGTFMHVVELPLALPLALVLVTALTGTPRNVAAAALCLLFVPWMQLWSHKKLFAGAVFGCALLLWRTRIAFVAACAILVAIAATGYAFGLHPPTPPFAHDPGPASPGDLVQIQYARFVAQLVTHDWLWFAIKIPSWCGLLALAALCAVAPRFATQTAKPST